MQNVYYMNGKYYGGNMNGGGLSLGGIVPNYSHPKDLEMAIKYGKLTPLAPPDSAGSSQEAFKNAPFTPNAITQAQLQGMNNMQTPQWMMDAYSSKIGKMGGNANLPPFGVTPSGFPGIAGKSAPTQGG
jgi:hypothetical protein